MKFFIFYFVSSLISMIVLYICYLVDCYENDRTPTFGGMIRMFDGDPSCYILLVFVPPFNTITVAALIVAVIECIKHHKK